MRQPRHAFVVLGLLVTTAAAQNREHPGLVHLGKGEWGTREQAEAAGLMEYRGRWLPRSLKAKVAKWEKQDEKTAGFDDAYRTASKHYRLVTDAPRHVVELEIKPFLDELYRAYVDAFRDRFGLKGKAVDKKFIRIYHGYRQYRHHTGKNRMNPGYIVNGEELVTFYEDEDPARFYKTVFHEGAHQFVKGLLAGADFPRWLDEGIASWFEGCSWSRATQEITVGHLPPDRLRFAQMMLRRQRDATPETAFLHVDGAAFTAHHYAMAWSFVHYVTGVEDGALADGFGRFLREMNGAGARPLAEVFAATVHRDFAELGAGWRDWVLALPAAEDEPHWVRVAVSGDCALRDGDLVWSADGVEIYSITRLRDVIAKADAAQRPFEVVALRPSAPLEQYDYELERVTATIGAGTGAAIRGKSALTRSHGLSD